MKENEFTASHTMHLPAASFGQWFRFAGTVCDVKLLIEDISLFTQHRGLVGSLKYTSRCK